jgi:hypothetical protein
MAEQLPVNFPIPAEQAIATYDWYDLASGVGYKSFYAMKLMLVSTNVARLTTNESLFSWRENTGGNNQAIDIDFDVTLNNNLVVYGDALISIPYVYNTGGSGLSSTLTASIYKVVGGVETQLGSTATENISMSSASSTGDVWSAGITLPLTVFKAGDTLRLTITAGAMGANKYLWIFHNPCNYTNTATGKTTSKLEMALPIKVDR